MAQIPSFGPFSLYKYYASQIQEHKQPWNSVAAFYMSIIAILAVL